MNRPGTEYHILADDQAASASQELAPLRELIEQAWAAEDGPTFHYRAGLVKGTIQAVIARLERVDKAMQAMRDQILNGEPVE